MRDKINKFSKNRCREIFLGLSLLVILIGYLTFSFAVERIAEQKMIELYAATMAEHATDMTLIDGTVRSHQFEIVKSAMCKIYQDYDNDQLSDSMEIGLFNTDPNNPDTDGDGYKDGEEIYNVYPPNEEWGLDDTDQDGLMDNVEWFYFGTDPNNPDSDANGIDDGTEVREKNNPLGPGLLPDLLGQFKTNHENWQVVCNWH